MRVNEFLSGVAKIGDVVIFREGGWQIGCTRKDNENLYLASLNPDMLKREVIHYSYDRTDWIIGEVLTVHIR